MWCKQSFVLRLQWLAVHLKIETLYHYLHRIPTSHNANRAVRNIALLHNTLYNTLQWADKQKLQTTFYTKQIVA